MHGGGMMGMGPVEIPAGGRVTFTPGGSHLMLSDFSAVPKAGDSLTVVLEFTRAGTVRLALPVRPYVSE
jgi:copper(I)-binding protein